MKRVLLPVTAVLAVLLLASIPAAVTSAQSLGKVYTHSGRDRGWLGVSIRDVDRKLAESKKLKANSGAYVVEVVEDSPAEKAGIREGDVIVKFDGKGIDDGDDLTRAVRRAEPGAEVSIVIDRKGETKTLSATLDEFSSPRVLSLTIPDIPTPRHPSGWSFNVGGSELGMEMQTLGKQLAEYFDVPGNRGVLVSSVKKDGAAAAAGMKAGDVIVRVNRNAVRDVDDVMEEVREAEADTVGFEVLRKGKTMTLPVEVGREREGASGIHGTGHGTYLFRLGREHYLDALEDVKEDGEVRQELRRELKEALRELQRDLRKGAEDLKREIRRAFIDS